MAMTYLSWTDFKNNIGSNTMYYRYKPMGYLVYFKSGDEISMTNLNVYADIQDFETNYKANATKINNTKEIQLKEIRYAEWKDDDKRLYYATY